MKRFARLLLVTVGLGTLGFVMTLVPQKNATGAGAAPVTITSPLPLPVTVMSGTVAAQQSGNWNVGITGTPTVNANVTFPNSLAVTTPTHLGVAAANLVTLECKTFNAAAECTSFSRVKTDGTVEDFSLQSGTGLVITDIQSLQSGGTAGRLGGLLIEAGCLPPILYQAFALPDTNGNIFVNDHITGGLHFTTIPCFELSGTLPELTVMGYLTKE